MGKSMESEKESEEKEDVLVEVPNLVGNELLRKSQVSMMDIGAMVVRCTMCRSQVNHNDFEKIKEHFKLSVLVCKDCYEFYGTSEFSQDESGNYNYCTWCGNGGKLYLCDFCPNSFCSSCVHYNFGRAEVTKMNKDGWKCIVCKPEKLKTKIAFCKMILEFSAQAKVKKEKTPALKKPVKDNELSWVGEAFDQSSEAIKSFQFKLQKLKKIETSKSKSLKHIIKKWEEITLDHKKKLKGIMITLSNSYDQYIKKQKENVLNKNNECAIEVEVKKHDIVDLVDNVIDMLSNSDVECEDDVSNAKLKDISSKINNDSEINDKNHQAKLELIFSDNSDSGNEVGEIIDEILKNDSPMVNDEEVESKHSDNEFVTSKSSPACKDVTDNRSSDEDITFKKAKYLSPSSDLSLSDSDTSLKKVKRTKNCKTPRKRYSPVIDYNDPKLTLKTSVILQRCDDLIPNGEKTIVLPEKYFLEDLDKKIDKLCKLPKENSTRKNTIKPENASSLKKQGVKVKKKSESSSDISFSTSDDDLDTKVMDKNTSTTNANVLAKKDLMSDSENDLFIKTSSEEEIVKKKPSKKAALNRDSDSSCDFQPRKKRKYDKLLSKRFTSDIESEKENSKDASDAENKKDANKSKKRKNTSKDDKKSNNSSSSSSSSESEKEEKKKKKKSRIKKAAVSSSEEEGGPDSQNTPNKGRKDIRKILSKKNLKAETKEAQQIEKERRKRVQERQHLYNQIFDTTDDGKDKITRKLTLDIDPVSKEEIEIHPDIVDKLKPHQIDGVKFMWECAIESLKELEEGDGSGCILAHCMGLGKTLQVISFLHTCLTNRFVNKRIHSAMVICPYNTLTNWAREFEKWLENVNSDVLVHQLVTCKSNYDRYEIIKYWHKDGGVLIINYDLFRRLAAKKVPKLKPKERENLHKFLLDPGADIVVCDEGHMLKNEKSAISKACALIATQRRIVLTGTPLQNNLNEYHCMMSFVKPNLLGTSKEFRNRFSNPIMNGQYGDSNEHDVHRMKKRIHILHKLLEGCVQRCDYSALTKFLPPKHEFVISVKLSEIQMKMYRWYLENKTTLKTQSKLQGTTLFKDCNSLRNLCAHPYIIHTTFQKAEMRRLFKEDDEEEEEFINDESEDEISAKSSNSRSESEEEVIKKYKTRSKANDSGAESEESVVEETKKEWYHEFISDEDRYKIEISGKMILLIDILKECEAIGDKCILFSQSLMTLDCVEDILNFVSDQELSEEDQKRDITNTWTLGLDYYRMDGGTSADNRKHFIDMFNDSSNDRARLFLVSTKAGGLGTNLVGANRVILLDCSWNPSHDVQAIFRVYRFGQKKPVYIYRLLGQATMEEKVYDRQVTKLSLSFRVVDDQQIDRIFNASELAELYTFEPDTQKNRPIPIVPNDHILAEMLIKNKDWIVTYHEHDSLLQNQTEEDLTEEERKAAWDEYENEREGRQIYGQNDFLDTMNRNFVEPDFSLADYEGVLIDLHKVIPEILQQLRTKYPTFSQPELRKKLHEYIFNMRAIFQERHVKMLRIKQEYLAQGSAPASVNKYLGELTTAINELNRHCNELDKLIRNDNKKLQEEAQMKYMAQINMRKHTQPVRFQNQQSHGFSGIRPGGNILNPGMHNFSAAANAFRLQQQFFQMAQNGLPIPSFSNNAAYFPSRPTRTYSRSQEPLISEPDASSIEVNIPQTAQSSSKSSVLIEEVE